MDLFVNKKVNNRVEHHIEVLPNKIILCTFIIVSLICLFTSNEHSVELWYNKVQKLGELLFFKNKLVQLKKRTKSGVDQLMIERSSKTETFCFYHKHDTCEKDCFDENDSWSIIFSRQCVLSSKCDCCVEPGLIG